MVDGLDGFSWILPIIQDVRHPDSFHEVLTKAQRLDSIWYVSGVTPGIPNQRQGPFEHQIQVAALGSYLFPPFFLCQRGLFEKLPNPKAAVPFMKKLQIAFCWKGVHFFTIASDR